MTATWSLRPNWRESYEVTYSHLTEVQESDAGREQRRAYRQVPRKSVEFTITVNSGRYRAATSALRRQQGAQLILPEVTACAWTTTALSAGGLSVTLEARPDWLSAGVSVALVYGDQVAAGVVAGIVGTTLTLEEATGMTWPAGETKVCPGLLVEMPDDTSLKHHAQGVAEGRLRFDVVPGSEPKPVMLPEPELMYAGREVFLVKPNWVNGVNSRNSRTVDRIDYGHGVTASFLPTAFGVQTWTADYLNADRARTSKILNLFLRLRGRQGEFFIPTDHPDLVLAASASQFASFIVVAGADARSYEDDPVYQHISILLDDGRRFFAKVTDIIPFGQDTRLNLSVPLGFALAPAAVVAISWLPVCRLASDDLTIEWLNDSVSQVRLSYQTLEALDAEA